MAITNRDRVGRAMDTLVQGLAPFVEKQMDARVGRQLAQMDRPRAGSGSSSAIRMARSHWDVQALLQTMVQNWREVFGKTLGHAERSLRRRAASTSATSGRTRRPSHPRTPIVRSTAPSACCRRSPPASRRRELTSMRQEVLRTVVRRGGAPADPAPDADARRAPAGRAQAVARGGDAAPRRRQRALHQAEFAADLAQVQRGDGSERVRRPGRVLPPHLPDRRPDASCSTSALRRSAASRAATRWSSCRPTSAAARPTRCSRSTTLSGHDDPKRAGRRGSS